MRLLLLTLALCLFAIPAYAACSGPTGTEGEIMYNADYATMQFCDGTTWWSMKGGGGGASNLAGLSDVDNALAPDDGEILVYNSASGKWVTGAPGLGSESDPQVGAVTNNQWCRGDGSAVQCDQAAPVIPPGMLCGLATGTAATPSCSSYSSVATCNGSSIVSSCPSGYTQRSISIWDGNSVYTCIRSCSKN